jgi:kumamolisin
MTRSRATRRATFATALVGVVLLVATASTVFVASRTRARIDAVDRDVNDPVLLGRTAADEPVIFDLVLRMPGQLAFDAYAREVDSPASPDFRHFLTPSEIGERFGPSEVQLARLDAELGRRDLAVIERYPERTALRVSGTARAVEAAFRVVLDDYRDENAHVRFHRPRRAPRLPASLRDMVRGVSGLDSRPPLLTSRAADIAISSAAPGSPTGLAPRTSLTPNVLNRAFEIEPLRASAIDGSGISVAILSFADLSDADVAAWDAATGTLGAPPIIRVRVGSGPSDDAATARRNLIEVALDVDTVRAVAPRAQIIVFSVDPSLPTFMADALRAVLRDGRATIFSASISACDAPRAFDAMGWDRESSLQEVKTARAAGLNLVFSTGDYGAYPCRGKYSLEDLTPTIAFPADTEYVTSVGGTTITRGADGTYIEETGWEDPLSLSGGGGGLSPSERRPSWQRGPGVDTNVSNGRRQVPDVAAPGDPVGGYFTVLTLDGQRRYAQVGGTSGATPFWAGLLALYEQYTTRAGLGRLGFVNPMLYEIAATNEANTVFHDIVRGGNLLFNATPGWDFSTGLGTPVASALGDAILNYRRAHAAL